MHLKSIFYTRYRTTYARTRSICMAVVCIQYSQAVVSRIGSHYRISGAVLQISRGFYLFYANFKMQNYCQLKYKEIANQK